MGVATQARWSLDTNLSVVSAVVHGLDVAATWRLSPTPGTFWLSYVVPPHAPLLVGVPPTVQLQLEDPRWVPGPLSLAPLPLFPNSDLGCICCALRLIACLTRYPGALSDVVVAHQDSPLFVDSFVGFAVDTEPPAVVVTGFPNGSIVLRGKAAGC